MVNGHVTVVMSYTTPYRYNYMECGCGNIVDKDNETVITLERLLLILNITDVDISKCCETCLQSMISDLQTELSARAEHMFKISDDSLPVEKFRESMRNKILRVEEINNLTLLGEFNDAINSDLQQLWLFHGSNDQNYISIATNGFDIKRSKNGLLGCGVYFAKKAMYSNSYTEILQTDKDRVMNMMLCNVYYNPKEDRYDKNAEIYCITNDRRAYPKYIVYYSA